jgi:hypothetical protein
MRLVLNCLLSLVFLLMPNVCFTFFFNLSMLIFSNDIGTRIYFIIQDFRGAVNRYCLVSEENTWFMPSLYSTSVIMCCLLFAFLCVYCNALAEVLCAMVLTARPA